MIYFESTNLQSIVIHKVGNKANEEGLFLSKTLLKTDEAISDLLQQYFLSPFKDKEYYNFFHEVDIKMNKVFGFASEIFDNPDCLLDQSVNLANHLYEQSTHPKIKTGELYVVYFDECIVDGETVEGIGLFKSESKETYLRVYPTGDNLELNSDNGINISKLDKGCLIFNSEKENGFLVAALDNTNKNSDAHYWFDDFLQIQQRKDEYFHTSNTIALCKDFITNKLPEDYDIDKADQADILNKSAKFFKDKDSFDMDEFAQEVIEQPEVIQSFKNYKTDYEQDKDIEISESFDISENAVKKQAKAFKSVLKLDKNFTVYIHGNKDFISTGIDDETGMKYYKMLYRDEK